MPRVSVQMLPALMTPGELSRQTAVVIDILRASTTIIEALAQGASAVLPCITIDEAREEAARRPSSTYLLGGERGGERIDGFHLGNSPREYTSQRVRDKVIVFTTTNGTRALRSCGSARRVYIGAFVNGGALVARLRGDASDVQLVCAGTEGQLTAEDILFAGFIADALLSAGSGEWSSGNVQAQMAVDFYRARSRDSESFRDTVYDSLGGRNLARLGMDGDIDYSLRKNLWTCVPQWDPATGEIRLSEEISPENSSAIG